LAKIVVVFLMFFSAAYSQNLTITGTVRDASTGEPLPFTNIIVKKLSTGTTTDVNGKFELEVQAESCELLISYIGYKTETITIETKSSRVNLDIRLVSTGVLLQEVSVYAAAEDNNGSVSTLSLQSKQIEQISSVLPDVFRSIQALPGVAVNNEFSAKFNVRGGNYDENLVLVNGAQVYEPFHIKEADNASIGIFNVDLMKSVNMMMGGFSAQYGDRLSSVLNIEYREGNRNRYTGAATMSLTHFDAFAEGPLFKNGSFIIGARKSYFEYVLSLLEVEEDAKPSFYDVQGVLNYNLSDVDKVQLKFIHAGDDFELKPPDEIFGPRNFTGRLNDELVDVTESDFETSDVETKYFSNLFDIKAQTFLSKKARLNTSVSYYEQIDDEYKIESGDYRFEAANQNSYFYRSDYHELFDHDLKIKTWEGKTDLDFRLTPFYDVKAGFSYLNINYSQRRIDEQYHDIIQNIDSFPDTLNYRIDEGEPPQNIDAVSYKLAGYVENVLQSEDNLILNLGARIDYFDINRDLTISPRISSSFKLNDGTMLRFAWGHYYQSPIYRQLAYSVPSDTNTQSQKAEHYIVSVERSFPFGNSNSITLKAEGYYKKYSDLISSERDHGGNVNYSRKNDSEGYVRGIDLYATLRLDNYYGWISYGLLYAKEDNLTDSMGEFPRYTDQRHTLSLVNDFDLGKNWDLNLRLTYGSGFAFTPFTANYNSADQRWEWIEGNKNSDHLPEYKRVDVRISKEFTLWGFKTIAFLDVNNLFDWTNIVSVRYRFYNNGNPYREELELFPIIPSIGITMHF
jgi:outer membrane receptor protein involved in Fe transport